MYASAAPALVWPVLATALVVEGVPVALVAALHAGLALLLGFYGNMLYLHHFRRLARTVREEDHGRRLAALAKLGGTDRRAAIGVAVLALILIVATAGLAADDDLTLRWM
jgi:hypothetical protein